MGGLKGGGPWECETLRMAGQYHNFHYQMWKHRRFHPFDV